MIKPPAPDADEGAKASGLGFDGNGPNLDGVRLTRRTRKGWAPVERDVLERELLTIAAFATGDFMKRLDAVCRAMNLGDFATAAIAAEHATRDLKRGTTRKSLGKASPDDPKRPGWPAGTPDGKGGKFRPKDGTASDTRAERLKRLAARRGLRSVLRRLLTSKRAARLAAELLGDAVPGLDVASGVASLADAVKLGEELAADAAETDAAITFAEKGPQALEELQVSAEPQGFSSYAAFQKADLDKRFGPAGEGYEYHHIVEQGSNASSLPANELQSTTNIIRVPRLLHEEVNAYYAKPRLIDDRMISLREFLRGKSYSEQFDRGLAALRDIGILR